MLNFKFRHNPTQNVEEISASTPAVVKEGLMSEERGSSNATPGKFSFQLSSEHVLNLC